jgi:hypothetical protein
METTTMEIVEFPQRQIVITEETKNVTVATDCQTRVIESWQMVSRIRSAEHLHELRVTELLHYRASWPRQKNTEHKWYNCKVHKCISEAQ